MRKLVAMVLEVLDIDFLACPDVAAALAVLRAAPVQLLITDLMMPGLSGYDLLQTLADQPALRAGAGLLVFSAGIDAQARSRLAPLGVSQVLGKPVSVQALEDAVRQALAASAAAVPAAPEPAAPAAPAADPAAITRYFAGQTALYAAYRAACIAEFASDLQTGEQALAARDGAGLQRLSHNLKSVLRMLGHEAQAVQAQSLETAAAQVDWAAAAAAWPKLAAVCRALRASSAT